MALSTTEYKARIDRQLQLLGKMDDNVKTDVIEDAVRYFITKMDEPKITANLSVTADTRYYDRPSTINKIIDVRDDSDPAVSKVYAEDTTSGQIVLQDTPDGAATWTVYGTPADVETNLDAIIAAIDEDYGYVVWACIVAFSHGWANGDQYITRLQVADQLIKKARASRNRRLDWGKTPVKQLDVKGKLIHDENNAEGFDADYTQFLANDLNQ